TLLPGPSVAMPKARQKPAAKPKPKVEPRKDADLEQAPAQSRESTCRHEQVKGQRAEEPRAESRTDADEAQAHQPPGDASHRGVPPRLPDLAGTREQAEQQGAEAPAEECQGRPRPRAAGADDSVSKRLAAALASMDALAGQMRALSDGRRREHEQLAARRAAEEDHLEAASERLRRRRCALQGLRAECERLQGELAARGPPLEPEGSQQAPSTSARAPHMEAPRASPERLGPAAEEAPGLPGAAPPPDLAAAAWPEAALEPQRAGGREGGGGAVRG
ncbi:unnamed protein product, partial [Prorocentrum cordatum]